MSQQTKGRRHTLHQRVRSGREMAPKGLIFALLAAATSDFERSSLSSSASSDKKKAFSTFLADAAWRRRMAGVAVGVSGALLTLVVVFLLGLSGSRGGSETRNEGVNRVSSPTDRHCL